MAKTEEWPDFGVRVRRRLRELGYVRPDGSEDISRFTVENGYVITLFYKYLTHTTPSRENLIRLARDLQTSVEWLLTGHECEEGARPKHPRRQGRRTAGSLLLACLVGAAGVFGWPTAGSAADSPGSLDGAGQLANNIENVPSRTLRRWLRAWWARPMQPVWCPA